MIGEIYGEYGEFEAFTRADARQSSSEEQSSEAGIELKQYWQAKPAFLEHDEDVADNC